LGAALAPGSRTAAHDSPLDLQTVLRAIVLPLDSHLIDRSSYDQRFT